jgi:hypothetical protein
LTDCQNPNREGRGTSAYSRLTNLPSSRHPRNIYDNVNAGDSLTNFTERRNAGDCRRGSSVNLHIAGLAASKDSSHINVSAGVHNDNTDPTNGGDSSYSDDRCAAHDRVADKPLRCGANREGPGSGVHSHLVNLAGGEHPSDREKSGPGGSNLPNLPSSGYPRGGYKGGPGGRDLADRTSGNHTGGQGDGPSVNGGLPNLPSSGYPRNRKQR